MNTDLNRNGIKRLIVTNIQAKNRMAGGKKKAANEIKKAASKTGEDHDETFVRDINRTAAIIRNKRQIKIGIAEIVEVDQAVRTTKM